MNSGGHLQLYCIKTQACRYFAKGVCRAGVACRFAHGTEDLNILPDLSCTKLCPVLARTGRCAKAECSYAHRREELRLVKLQCRSQALASPSRGPCEAFEVSQSER